MLQHAIIVMIRMHRDVTVALVTSSHWQELMRFCIEDNETPMRLLIKHMPGEQITVALLSTNMLQI